MKILGLSGFYHDSSAALVNDGNVIHAVHEERYSRLKQDSRFPHNSIYEILGANNLNISDIDKIVWYENPELKKKRAIQQTRDEWPNSKDSFFRFLSNSTLSKKSIEEILKNNYRYNSKLFFSEHHLSHAACAIFGMQGNGKSLIFTADGVGELQSASAYVFDYSNFGSSPELVWDMQYPSSIGLFYSAVTQLLGFEINEGEYKVMGLAPYGEPTLASKIIENAFTRDEFGFLRISKGIIKWSSDTVAYGEKLSSILGLSKPINSKFALDYANIAASTQKALEFFLIDTLEKLIKEHNPQEIRLAGGVALNCTANSAIARKFSIPIHIPPAAGDAGTALGAALLLSYQEGDLTHDKLPLRFPYYLGTTAETKSTRETIIALNKNRIRFESSANPQKVAELLAAENVVAVSRGRAEFGPRALGNRCILASPLNADMKEHLNASIKFREEFRPFAPITTEIAYETFFETLPGSASELMLFTVISKQPECIPAVTHVDNTSRVQKLNKSDNEWLHEVITIFGQITGIPVLTLTSFNLKGEPMVQNSNDAISTFLRSKIDYLILENEVFSKKSSLT